MIVAYLQAEAAQANCVSCDVLGNFFQENASGTRCIPCPPNSQRYLGVLTGGDPRSCQCKEGYFHASSDAQTPTTSKSEVRTIDTSENRGHGGLRPTFAVSFALLQGCSACPAGALCKGKLHRPTPIQGRGLVYTALRLLTYGGTKQGALVARVDRVHVRCAFDPRE